MSTLTKDKEAGESAAAAREELLRAEIEQARTRADTMSRSLVEVRLAFGMDFRWTHAAAFR